MLVPIVQTNPYWNTVGHFKLQLYGDVRGKFVFFHLANMHMNRADNMITYENLHPSLARHYCRGGRPLPSHKSLESIQTYTVVQYCTHRKF